MGFDHHDREKPCGCVTHISEHDFFNYSSESYSYCAEHQKIRDDEEKLRREKEKLRKEQYDLEKKMEKERYDLAFENSKEECIQEKEKIRAIKTDTYVPIKYAVEKSGMKQPKLIERYSNLLEINKNKNRWYCSKERSDAIDFSKFSFSYDYGKPILHDTN